MNFQKWDVSTWNEALETSRHQLSLANTAVTLCDSTRGKLAIRLQSKKNGCLLSRGGPVSPRRNRNLGMEQTGARVGPHFIFRCAAGSLALDLTAGIFPASYRRLSSKRKKGARSRRRPSQILLN